MVKNFLDVHSEELPKLPSKRKISLEIDLILSTAPILLPPYGMAATKIKELKEKLQDLEEKGFVQLSVSS